jgi:hypothetical protein
MPTRMNAEKKPKPTDSTEDSEGQSNRYDYDDSWWRREIAPEPKPEN